jgi:hypothetical protein
MTKHSAANAPGNSDRKLIPWAILFACSYIVAVGIWATVAWETHQTMTVFVVGCLTLLGVAIGGYIALHRDAIGAKKPTRTLLLTVGVFAAVVLLVGVSLAIVQSQRTPGSGGASAASISTASSAGGSNTSAFSPAPTSTTNILTEDDKCSLPNPSDKKIPDYLLCVMLWCQGGTVFPNGQPDPSRIQIKVHPRIGNQTNDQMLDIALQKPAALRMLVRSSDLPYSWNPPPMTKSMGDDPYLVTAPDGQDYWAVAPNLPHDVDLPDPAHRENGMLIGFATFWEGTVIPPNLNYPPLTYNDDAGNPVQQGDLVFQLPSHTATNNADALGLALIDRANPTKVLAVAWRNDWGPRRDPQYF